MGAHRLSTLTVQPKVAKHVNQVPEEGASGAGGELRIRVAALTDVGKARKNNEDNLLVFDLGKESGVASEGGAQLPFAWPGFLLGVADGMGGHNSGQVASRLCVENFPTALLALMPGAEAPAEERGAALKRAIEVTNGAIFAAAKKSTELEGMGTTLTVAWVLGRQAVVAQVGDSRAYHLRGGELKQLTRDQTLLNSLSEADREALLNTPFENMLLQAVGAMERLDIPVVTAELSPGDSLLLCSDGLYRVVTPAQMAEILQRSDPLPEKTRALIDLANAGGGPDNVTVVVCQVTSGGERSAA